MKKLISFTTQGERAGIGRGIIHRIVPNKYTKAIGAFVSLDHLLLLEHLPGRMLKRINKNRAHPVSGIATITYFMNDEGEYYCSKDYQAYAESGAQRMNDGNRIVRGRGVNDHSHKVDVLINALQFCVNLTPKEKLKSPLFLPIEANEIPKQMLSGNRGWVKLVVGEYENLACKIEGYTKQFLYHFHLESGKQISTTTENGLDYAIFLPLHNAVINGIEFNKGDVIEFDKQEGCIDIYNNADVAADIIVFGGEKCP